MCDQPARRLESKTCASLTAGPSRDTFATSNPAAYWLLPETQRMKRPVWIARLRVKLCDMRMDAWG